MLCGSSCLLVGYENAPANVAATQLSWLVTLCFLAHVVWIREEYNSVLSIPTTAADKIGRDWYIGEIQISADISARPVYRSISTLKKADPETGFRKTGKELTVYSLWSRTEPICQGKILPCPKLLHFSSPASTYISATRSFENQSRDILRPDVNEKVLSFYCKWY